MRLILISGGVALLVAILLTPLLIKVFSRQGFGQEIRVEGPESHKAKRGTPTMGGVAIIVGMWAGYWCAHLVGIGLEAEGPSASGLLVLGLATVLGIVGFLDDFLKVRKQRNLGLNKTAKTVGQLIAAVIFAVLVLRWVYTEGDAALSYVRDIDTVTMNGVVFVIFCLVLVSAWSNAVNFTDGLDGLAAGAMSMVLGAYVIITFWQYRNACSRIDAEAAVGCYHVDQPLDLALIAAAAGAACLGFLWWNAAPAKIFMGDTGSLALGGLIAGLSVTTKTELLAVVLGALFVAEAASVVIQIAVFRTSGRRVFRMAPFHHHFEMGGWPETTVIIRFWLLAGIASAVGLALFYGEYLTAVGS
ncbi:phospho-N-acetylmuramoyl-pentapeptide-transferase [Tomitella gaofuii]|uniref:phospho-N-acetylmuramoyl-pentapeptide- transferase n=1 Tax=Tomitella gaofuii TaxID=2760083 RepID=UPI0015F8F605|nr:phospho-N-acetylmuramoyl-pentapeptide-transferase [Tomitella gaofuii]